MQVGLGDQRANTVATAGAEFLSIKRSVVTDEGGISGDKDSLRGILDGQPRMHVGGGVAP